jgi:hypothetical protein
MMEEEGRGGKMSSMTGSEGEDGCSMVEVEVLVGEVMK